MRKLIILVLTGALVFGVAPRARAEPELLLQRPVRGEMLRGFDHGIGPYDAGHRGVDLAAEPGDAVRAAADGRVSFTGVVAGQPSVSVQHADGRRTTYTPVVGSLSVGTFVTTGQRIGTLSPLRHCEAQGCLHWGLTDGSIYWDPLQLAPPPRVRLLPRGTRPAPPPISGIPAGELPVAGPVTSRFGMRRHPITGESKLHDGTDFAAACGTPVTSPWEGVVTRAHFSSGYGYRVVLDHDGFSTAYAHLPRPELGVGDRVAAGGRVGAVGNTGLSTGCHLHWMAWRGSQLVDPLTLIQGGTP